MQACSATAEQGLRYARPGAARRGRRHDLTVIARPVAAHAMWTAIPLAALWFPSQLTDSSTHIGTAPLVVVAGGIPVAMALATRLLARVERRYMRITGTDPESRNVPA